MKLKNSKCDKKDSKTHWDKTQNSKRDQIQTTNCDKTQKIKVCRRGEPILKISAPYVLWLGVEEF